MEPKPKKRTDTLSIILMVGVVLGLLIGGVVAAFRIFIAGLEHRVQKAELWMEDLASGREERLTFTGANLSPRFSPNGKSIVFIHQGARTARGAASVMEVYSLPAKTCTPVLTRPGGLFAPAWTPDGRFIVFGQNENEEADLWRLSLADGSARPLTRDPEREADPAPSPDGKWIAFLQKAGGDNDELFIMPSGGGAKRPITAVHSLFLEPKSLAWAPDSSRIAYAAPLKIVLIAPDGTVQKEISTFGLQNLSNLFFHPRNANRLFFKARVDPTRVGLHLLVMNVRTEQWEPVEKSQLVSHYDISPDGKKLVYEKTSD